MKAYSEDLRQKRVQTVQQPSKPEAARFFGISLGQALHESRL
jgi:hypothetical protein